MKATRETDSLPAGAPSRGGGFHTISFKAGLIFSLVTLIAVTNIYVVHTLSKGYEGIAETVNVTGRLRMLTQQYAYDASKMFYADSQGDALFAISEEVQNTLNALLTGGQLGGYYIAALSEERHEQVQRIRADWHGYEAAVWNVFGHPEHVATAAHLLKIEQIAGRLLASADGLVFSVTADAQRMQRKSLVKIYMLASTNIVLLAALWFFSRTQITRPLNQLAHMGRLLGEGQFDRRVSTRYQGEIGQLAAALNYAAGQISESVEQIKRDREQLSQAETMFRGLADNSMAGVYIVRNGRFTYVNQKLADMFSHSRDEMLASLLVADILEDGGRRLGESKAARQFADPLDQLNDAVVGRRSDGSTFEVEIFGSTMQLGDQLATIGIMLDVTDRNRASRGICLLSACNQAIVHASSESGLQEAVCGILTRIGRYPFAWSGIKDDEGGFKVSGQAETRAGQFTSLLGTPTWDLLKDTAAGVLRANKTLASCISSTALDEAASQADAPPFKDLRILSIPLRSAGQAVGILSIFSEDPDAFGEHEVIVLEEVASNLGYGMFALHAETLRQQYAEKLKHQAHHDALTGLANRSLLSDRLKQAIAMAQRLEKQVAVLMLDLDKFKVINDTHGHVVGDLLLKAVAERLNISVRKTDTVARLGGDEFVVLLTNIKREEEVDSLAKKVMATFHKPFQLGDLRLHAQSSIGIALYPQHGDEEQVLLGHADTAMYHVKQQGRNGYCFYRPSMERDDQAVA